MEDLTTKQTVVDNQHKKISGHRGLSEEDMRSINNIKAMSKAVEDFINAMPEDSDNRWINVAKAAIHRGFTALTKSVEKTDFFLYN